MYYRGSGQFIQMTSINTKQWKRVEELFHKLLDLPEEDYGARLKDIEREHPELAADVKQLVHAHRESGAFLAGTVSDEFIVTEGERIGPWEVRQKIGEGGMSTVYLARRADGAFEREVAVKFLHGLFPGRQMIERLKQEQSILAGLNHPNICSLVDAGVTKNGRPYFIMEYVEGVPADTYCEAGTRSADEILNLFEQICEAVIYAHQHLVVHRDLKPGNILVNSNGRVKLLDFGIAKLVSEDPELDVSNTKTALHLMTPEYASPEQIEYKSVTTRSDIYSLGLLLCKLLTGELPYDLKGKTPLEMGTTILEAAPQKPSSLLNKDKAGEREVYSKRSAEIRGDLDNIILKALRKDPERRYRSADQFLEDIRNFRADRPVSARAESVVYRSRKFMKRNRTGVASAAFVLMLIVASALFSIRQAAIATSQRQLAEQRLMDVRQLTTSLMFDLHDSISDLPGSTPAREQIANIAREYLDLLGEIENPDTGLLLELAAAHRKIGDLLGNPTTSNLGRRGAALHEYEQAAGMLDRVDPDDRGRRDFLRQAALLDEKRADLYGSTGNLTEAESYQRSSVERFHSILEQFPDSVSEFSYAVSLLKFGDLLGHPNFSNLGMPDSSLVYYNRSEPLLSALAAQHRASVRYIRYNGLIHERLGVLHDYLGDFESAIKHLETSKEFRDLFLELDPNNTNAIRDRAVSLEKMAQIYQAEGLLTEARSAFTEAFETYKWLWETDPGNTVASQSLAVSHIHLGDLSFHKERPNFGDPETARDHFLESRQILTRLQVHDSTNTRTSFLLNLVENRLKQ